MNILRISILKFSKVFKLKLDSDTIKLLVLFIFIMVHENVRFITCPQMNLNSSTLDEIPSILRIKKYGPDRYGLNLSLITNYVYHKDVNGIIETLNYKDSVLNKAHSTFCKLFGNIFVTNPTKYAPGFI